MDDQATLEVRAMEKEHFEILLEHMQSQFKIFGEGLEGLRTSLDSFKVEVRERFDRLEGRMDNLDGRMDNLDGRMDNLDGRMDSVESRLGRIELDVRDIKRTVGLLHAIANDHETRLQNVESKLEDHLTNHS